jgi:hypothetical protein
MQFARLFSTDSVRLSVAIGATLVVVGALYNVKLNLARSITTISTTNKPSVAAPAQLDSELLLRRILTLHCAAQQAHLAAFLRQPLLVPTVVTGSSHVLRSRLVQSALACASVTVVRVDLNAFAPESVTNWTDRLSLSQLRLNSNSIATMVTELYSLFFGRSVSLDFAAQMSDEQGPGALLVINRFRDALRLAESDLLALRTSNAKPVCLWIDGLESIAHLVRTDVGRRAISIFLDFLSRLAAVGAASVICTMSESFFVEWCVFNDRCQGAAIVALPDTIRAGAVAELVRPSVVDVPDEVSVHVDEVVCLVHGQFDNAVRVARARFAAALAQGESVVRAAPLALDAPQAMWQADQLRALLLRLASGPPMSLEEAFAIVPPTTLLVFLRARLVSFDSSRMLVVISRAAERIALHSMNLSS